MTDVHHSSVREAGFSLLELLVVIAIMALLAVMATPALKRPSDGVRLQSTVSDVLSALRRTRSAAIARNTDAAVTIDVDKGTIEAPVGRSLRLNPDIAVHLKIAEPERTAPQRGAFRFFADGSSTGGNITLMLQGRETYICVDWLTGRAQQAKQC